MRVRFGDCVLDSDGRQLFHRGKLVHILPKAFRLLELLVAKRPRALSKQEIHDAIEHAAVVARELGIPCIVNTRNGTRAIRRCRSLYRA